MGGARKDHRSEGGRCKNLAGLVMPRAAKKRGRRFELVDAVDAQADELVDGQVFHAAGLSDRK